MSYHAALRNASEADRRGFADGVLTSFNEVGRQLFVLPLVGHDGLDGMARPGSDLPGGIKDPSTLFIFTLQPVRHATLLRSTSEQSEGFELAGSTIKRTHYNPQMERDVSGPAAPDPQLPRCIDPAKDLVQNSLQFHGRRWAEGDAARRMLQERVERIALGPRGMGASRGSVLDPALRKPAV